MRLSAGVKEDFTWWLHFSQTFNGEATILGPNIQSWSIYSDASSSGYGALFGTNWIVGNFGEPHTQQLIDICTHHCIPPPPVVNANSHINEKEMAAIFSAYLSWSDSWKDNSLVFITDNIVVQCALNSGCSKNKVIMYFLRRIL